MDPTDLTVHVPSVGWGAALSALVLGIGVAIRGLGRKVHAEGDAIAAIVAQVAKLEARVAGLEKELDAERKARALAEHERDEARTGRHNAILDADRRLAEAADAIERSAKERARWERIARDQAQAYEDLVRSLNAGFSSAAPPDRMDELDTIPPPRG